MDKLYNDNDAIKDRIFALLKDSNLSQKEFADILQVSPQTITDWKKGKSNSFTGKIGPICAALHTTVSWLLTGEGIKYISNEESLRQESEKLNKIYSGLYEAEKDTTNLLVHAMNHLCDLSAQRGTCIPVLGDVAAGIPIEAITDIVDYEEIDAAMASTGEFFGLRIKGASMEPRMREGDVVIVRKQDTAETGNTVVVLVNGDSATVKKIKYGLDGISLIPTNPAYDVQFYSAADVERLPVRVIGRVVELRAKY